MRLKAIYLLVALVMCGYYCKGQDTAPKIRSIDDVAGAIIQQYKPNTDSVKNACWEGCVFVRFTIDSTRQFANIAYTRGTPVFIIQAIQRPFERLNHYGLRSIQLNDGLGETYILPMIIGHNEGCDYPSGWDEKPVKRDAKLDKLYEERQSRFDHSMQSLLNLMSFTDGKPRSIRCVLLAPAQIAAIMR